MSAGSQKAGADSEESLALSLEEGGSGVRGFAGFGFSFLFLFALPDGAGALSLGGTGGGVGGLAGTCFSFFLLFVLRVGAESLDWVVALELGLGRGVLISPFFSLDLDGG